MRAAADVTVVGTGPNGLAAAIVFAAAGLTVSVCEAQPRPGGGARTEELDLGVPLLHDLCSAVHPMAMASPFFQRFELSRRVEFGVPEVSYAHPLDDGPAAVAYHDLDRTVAELSAAGPADGRRYAAMMRPLVDAVHTVRDIGLSDLRHPPASLWSGSGVIGAATLAARALELGTRVWGRVTDAERCGAMLTGVGAHANTPIPSLAGAATALLLGSLAHDPGWPLPVGGSQAITDAMVDDLRARGVTVECDLAVDDAASLPPARVYVFDTAPWTLDTVFGDRLPVRYRRALRRFTPGNGVAKVDFALREPVPWADSRLRKAGTVHLGGTRAQMARAEADTGSGRHSATPMMLVSQPTVVDPSRLGPGGEHPLWSYAHVPNGSTRDMTATAIAQIERFAPGFRDVVIGSRCIPAADLSRHNANYRGGDIAVGTVSMYRMLARPVLAWDPYRTPLGNVYLCSAATPPGPGVHGMSGMHAAGRVLRQHFGISTLPDLAPR
ncbi:phytoene desaturase family protein [Mycolicibacterium psychrotolerans]|uniref:Dehydrogenase n=1 Tax=Mycolicibacterium psychrotolerans TaxID=216929 RepID=A0A7I7MEH8_9MYCO|nr:NAD(P)/FAD-dependent oxidoreductase [Mycolicibacterium psychrotolerans]BBX70714.1 dehydrogenase [Mycolicibacterium psychrotolerans]